MFTDNSNTQETNQQETLANKDNSGNDKLENLLASIVNESGERKYKTVEAALEGSAHAQEYIQTLKATVTEKDSELERLRKEAEKVAELEALVASLADKKEESLPAPSGITETEVTELVNRTLAQKSHEQQLKNNQEEVVTTLVKRFGDKDKAQEAFLRKAEELGIDAEELEKLSSQNPKLVLSSFGISDAGAHKQPMNASPTVSSVNTSGFKSNEESYIRAFQSNTPIGATYKDLQAGIVNAKKMVEELESKGLTIDDLTKPSNFFKYFN